MIRKLGLLLIISGFALVIISQIQGNSEIVEWKEFRQAEELAKKTNKPILVYFHSESCPSCRMMDAEVFSDRKVADILNNDFIPVKVDVEGNLEFVKSFLPFFKAKHLDFVTPSFIILDPSGNVVAIEAGYLNRTEFINFILSYNK